MSDFHTVLIEDSRLQMTDEMTYGVVAGAAQSSYQSFVAQTASASNVIWNVIVPSEQIAIDKNILMKSQINFTLNITPNVNGIENGGVGLCVWQYGLLDALQSFPFNRLINTANAQINNSSTSINLKDVLPSLLSLYDQRELNRYKSLCPCLVDSYYSNCGSVVNYDDGAEDLRAACLGVVQTSQNANQLVVGPTSSANAYGITNVANNSPLSDLTGQGLDRDFVPRGAFKFDKIQIIQIAANGTDFYSYSSVLGAVGNTFKVICSFTTTEPLFISPFTLSPSGNNQAALMGINNMNIQFNIDSAASRLLSSATGYFLSSNGTTMVNESDAYSVSLGAQYYSTTMATGAVLSANLAESLQPFVNPTLLINMLTLQPSQYGTIKSRNVLPYFDIPRYLSNPSQNTSLDAFIPTGRIQAANASTPAVGVSNGSFTMASAPLTSTSLQLNIIPDKIIITIRKPMAQQGRYDPDAFLIINQISVSFNNVQGLLANCTQEQLYRMSVMNGSNQSWEQFRGLANTCGKSPTQLTIAGATQVRGSKYTLTGSTCVQTTSGSVLVIDPKDLNLPDFLSAGSLGQFQLFFTVNVSNQFAESITPEICVVCLNSGIFTTMQGASQFNVGLLTKQKVLDTKKGDPVSALDTHAYERLVGGRVNDSALSGLAQLVRKYRHRKGAGPSGGGASGGRLSRHLM
jgi:hypothetical protein